MGYRHTKEDILAAALDAAFDGGLAQLSYGRVGKRFGISDRTVVYYFPTKDDLIGEVLSALGVRLQTALLAAFASPAHDHRELLRAAWPVVATTKTDPTFALLLEASGLATMGREPYRKLVPQLMDAWIVWAADYITGSPEHRRKEAEAAVAVIDGLLLLRQISGPAAADRAAQALGIAS